MKSWDVQHDIIAFNSYLSYWSHCYICKFNAVCFSYYLDDSQATNWTSTSRISTCASEQNEWSWKIFEFTSPHYVLPRNSHFFQCLIWSAKYDMFVCTCMLHLHIQCSFPFIPGGPQKRNSRFFRIFRTVIFLTLLDRASFPHYNNIKIMKFGWELLILWVISYGLSFSGFARFPEFRGTINDSFSSTCANTCQHSTSYKEISVPITCMDCKSLLGNTNELQTQAPWKYTDHWTQYSLNLWTTEGVINRASQIPKMTVHKKLLKKQQQKTHQIWWSWWKDALSSKVKNR